MNRIKEDFVVGVGDLQIEVKEISELLEEKEDSEKLFSVTEECTEILTIVCC